MTISHPLKPATRWGDFIRQSYGLLQSLAVLILLVVVMSLISPRFMTATNAQNLMAQMAAALIVAVGEAVVMINGEFDISVGSVVALTASVAASLMPTLGVVPSVVIALCIGPIFGLVAGIIVTKGKIPSFITTLGTMMIARSLAFVTTGGQVISNLPPGFKVIGQGRFLGIPLPFIIAMCCMLAGWVLLRRTAFGKKVYAVGANRTVAVLSGVRADNVKILCLVIAGFAASFAGVVLLARIGAIQADTGRGLEFEVIAAVVIGGVSLGGGQGNILRVIVGVVVIALIRNFLNLSRIDIFWEDFATGSIIIGAVLLDALQKRIQRWA